MSPLWIFFRFFSLSISLKNSGKKRGKVIWKRVSRTTVQTFKIRFNDINRWRTKLQMKYGVVRVVVSR